MIRYRRRSEGFGAMCVTNKALTFTWTDSRRVGGEGLAPCCSVSQKAPERQG